MSHTLSRILAATELMVLLIPASVRAVFGVALLSVTARPFSPMADLMSYVLVVGYAGLPLLIPLAHVSIERWRQMHSLNGLDHAAVER